MKVSSLAALPFAFLALAACAPAPSGAGSDRATVTTAPLARKARAKAMPMPPVPPLIRTCWPLTAKSGALMPAPLPNGKTRPARSPCSSSSRIFHC